MVFEEIGRGKTKYLTIDFYIVLKWIQHKKDAVETAFCQQINVVSLKGNRKIVVWVVESLKQYYSSWIGSDCKSNEVEKWTAAVNKDCGPRAVCGNRFSCKCYDC